MGLVSDRINQFSKSSAINNNLTWGDVGAMKISGRPVRNAFLDAKMVVLPAKTKLYKFNTYQSLMPDKDGNVTPWWSPYDEYDVDPGWLAKEKMAKRLGVSIRELGRVTSAITESWNSLEYLVEITLKVDICVAYGRFAQMVRNDGGTKTIIEVPKNLAGTSDQSRFRTEGKLNKEIETANGKKKVGTIHLPGGGRQFFIPNLKPIYYSGVQSKSLLFS